MLSYDGKPTIKMKKEELQFKFRKMYWLLGWRSDLSIPNKLRLYKQVLRPIWTYGIQLWGCAKKSNIDLIQYYQNRILRRSIVNAPWYSRNSDIHRELGVEKQWHPSWRDLEASVAQWLACWTAVPKIAGSNPAEAFGFFMSVKKKNPSVCLPFGWGSKAGGPMS